MAFINVQQKEIEVKLVYYGPAFSGKTTNLHGLHTLVPSRLRGPLTTLDTDAERTLFFDYFPLKVGNIGAYRLKLHVYSVPGQAHYRATRNLVLRDADGVVFVADSQTQEMDNNLEALRDLEAVLRSYGVEPEQFPTVFQYNKQDLPTAESVETLNHRLNARQVPFFGTSAVKGTGIVDCFNELVELVSARLRHELKAPPEAKRSEVLRTRSGAKVEDNSLAELVGRIGELGEHEPSEITKAMAKVQAEALPLNEAEAKVNQRHLTVVSIERSGDGLQLELHSPEDQPGGSERVILVLNKALGRELIEALEPDFLRPRYLEYPIDDPSTAATPKSSQRDWVLGLILVWMAALTLYLVMGDL